MALYAEISGGIVQNIIQLNDPTQVPAFTRGYDAVIDVTAVAPTPQIGWTWSGQTFAPPPPAPPSVDPLQVPQMSSASRNLLSPNGGMLVYNTDTGTLQVWKDQLSKWVDAV